MEGGREEYRVKTLNIPQTYSRARARGTTRARNVAARDDGAEFRKRSCTPSSEGKF